MTPPLRAPRRKMQHPYQEEIDRRSEQLQHWEELPKSEQDRLIDMIVEDALNPAPPPVITRVMLAVDRWTPAGWEPYGERLRTFPGARTFKSGLAGGVPAGKATHRLTWTRAVYVVQAGGKVDPEHPVNYREQVVQFAILGGK